MLIRIQSNNWPAFYPYKFYLYQYVFYLLYLFYLFFLTKQEISKSVSLFLIHIGQNWYWPIRLKDFKSIIYLEESDEIIYIFLHIDTGNEDKMITRWMDKWMDELSWFFAYWYKFRKVKDYFNSFWVIMVKNVHGTLISKCMNEPGLFFACYTYLRELKVTLIVIRRAWWNIGCPFRSWYSIICCIVRMN